MDYKKEINKRRTFGIISHPDAGKTTLTEKLLLLVELFKVLELLRIIKLKNQLLQILWKLKNKGV